jgi:DNA-binding beta-propeller fold protein YncE
MSDTPGDELLYPNRGDEGASRPASGRVSRRRLLAGSAAGVAATAGCAGSSGDEAGGDDRGSPTVFVFNTGDRTVSVIDSEADELVTTTYLGATSSFPANQFVADHMTTEESVMWLNVGNGIRAFSAGSLSEELAFETGSGANWQEVTPDGSQLVVSAREPTHVQYRIDADPTSETFGEVTGEIDRKPEGGRGENRGPGPCDVTIHPDGQYAYVPDIFGDTLSVIDVEAFEIVTQVSVEPTGDADAAKPWMGTAAWDGESMLVENNEGEAGTESIWDVGDPANPEEVARLTAEDGLGKLPLTSEIGPDSAVGYVFTTGTNDVTVVDLAAAEVTDRIDLGGSAFVGTWGPNREKLYIPVQTTDEVKVLDHAAGEIVETISVGSEPYGATAGRIRPRTDTAANMLGTMAALGIDVATEGTGTTYCIGNCACGHEL